MIVISCEVTEAQDAATRVAKIEIQQKTWSEAWKASW